MNKTMFSPLLGGVIATLIFWLYSLTTLKGLLNAMNIELSPANYIQTAFGLLTTTGVIIIALSYLLFPILLWIVKKIKDFKNLTEKQMWFIMYVLSMSLGIIFYISLKTIIHDRGALFILCFICLPFGMLFNTSFYSVLANRLVVNKSQ